MYAYKEPYNYPYGKYLMIKKFGNINEQILEKAKLLVSCQEITIDENGNKHLLFKEGSPFDNIVKPIETEIQNVYGDIFEDYEGLRDSYEAEYCMKYLRIQYYLAAVALRFFSNLSPIEAAFEAAFLEHFLFFSSYGHLKPWNWRFLYPELKDRRKEFLDTYILSDNCLNIYLAVIYLEQLGLSNNPVKNKALVSKIQEGMRRLEQDMEKRKLTKEEWEAREKARSKFRVRY